MPNLLSIIINTRGDANGYVQKQKNAKKMKNMWAAALAFNDIYKIKSLVIHYDVSTVLLDIKICLRTLQWFIYTL
jgi:hypothetical protein